MVSVKINLLSSKKTVVFGSPQKPILCYNNAHFIIHGHFCLGLVNSLHAKGWIMGLKPVNVGICGLGTVGGGTFNVLKRNEKEIQRRAGRAIRVQQVATLHDNPDCDTQNIDVSRDALEVAKNPDIDIIVELIGGYTLAKDVVMTAIEHGKHVVTANKALIAVHGNEIFAAAQEKNVIVAFEASVAGGIPIIKAIREGLSANKIQWLAGIINGTGNFILTEMKDKGRAFEDVLKEAQELGYAEADPTFDVEGIDAAHKLTIMASLAFGIPLQFEKAYTEGISAISTEDVMYAEELGYRIKHLGVTRRTEKGIELRVHPTLIPAKRLLANVDGVMNAVLVEADAVGSTLYYGAGAGSEPTASAVIADLVDIARSLSADPESRVPSLAFQASELVDTPVMSVDDITTGYYLRMQAEDHPGVLSEVTRILSQQNISIDSILQKGTGEELVPIIILTHEIQEKYMNAAIAEIEQLDDIHGKVTRIRVEQLDAS